MFECGWKNAKEVTVKKIIGLFLLMLSLNCFAETYSCSAELSNFGQSGTVENTVYTRTDFGFIGNSNYAKNSKYKILYESNTDLMLYQIDQYDKDATIFMVVINKISLKFRQEYLTFSIDPKTKSSLLIGKCNRF